jgi:homoserine dehydrogenase
VGREFVRVLATRQKKLEAEFALDVRLAAVLGRDGGVCSPGGLDIPRIANLARGSDGLRGLSGLWQDGLTGSAGITSVKADVLVEATPTNVVTAEPGISNFRAAMDGGMDIVTFNKGPLVKAYRLLKRMSEEKGLVIKASGATAAALPTLDIGQYCLAGDTILQFEGILNGTTNYILTRMSEENIAYTQALSEAIAAGIAETNPGQDVEGWDTASKAVILANMLMDTESDINDVRVQGIQGVTVDDIRLASSRGEVIKLIGQVVRDENGVTITVGPKALPLSHPLSGVKGRNKGIRFISRGMGEITVTGGRSDLTGTAHAGLKDIINLAREKYGCLPGECQ